MCRMALHGCRQRLIFVSCVCLLAKDGYELVCLILLHLERPELYAYNFAFLSAIGLSFRSLTSHVLKDRNYLFTIDNCKTLHV